MLYGVTLNGGDYNGGTVFSLTPPSSPGGNWNQTVLHSFPTCPYNASCDEPNDLIYDNATGYLYGLTTYGGIDRVGTAFHLSPPTSAEQSWDYSALHEFENQDGAEPSSLLINRGFLYGTTRYEGGSSAGTVFSLQP